MHIYVCLCVRVHIYVLFNHKKLNHVIFSEMDETSDHHVKWYKLDSESQMSHVVSHINNLGKN